MAKTLKMLTTHICVRTVAYKRKKKYFIKFKLSHHLTIAIIVRQFFFCLFLSTYSQCQELDLFFLRNWLYNMRALKTYVSKKIQFRLNSSDFHLKLMSWIFTLLSMHTHTHTHWVNHISKCDTFLCFVCRKIYKSSGHLILLESTDHLVTRSQIMMIDFYKQNEHAFKKFYVPWLTWHWVQIKKSCCAVFYLETEKKNHHKMCEEIKFEVVLIG